MRMHRFARALLGSSVLLGSFVFALPTFAAGNYYAFAGDPAASDSNSCQVVTDPCATLGGALEKIHENIDPSNATIYAKGTFVESVSVNRSEYSGLTITAYDLADRPVIDANEWSVGLSIGGPVSDVTVEHVDVTNASNYGVYVSGGSYSHSDNITLSDLTIHDFAASSSSHYGMYISSSDHVTVDNVEVSALGGHNLVGGMYASAISVDRSNYLTIKNSSFHNLDTSTVDPDGDTYYGNLYGVAVNNSDHLKIRNNTFSHFSSTVSKVLPATVYNTISGINLDSDNDVLIRGNTLTDFTVDITANGDGSNGYSNIFGIYGNHQNDVVLRNNSLTEMSNTFTDYDTSYGNPTFYGIWLAGSQNSTIRANTLKNLSVNANNLNSDANMYGIAVDGMSKTVVHHNTIKNTTADSLGHGGQTLAIQLTNAPKSNLYNNKIADFTMHGVANTKSEGIELGYNTDADVFNNAIYFTAASTQETADGIVLLSEQSTPTRIFHNTIARMSTCLDVQDLGETQFMNNVCYMVDGGAYGVEVTSGTSDLTKLTSDYNSFYNAAGVLSFHDTTEGILALGDWQSGIYAQDAHSVTVEPGLTVTHPTSANYLHLNANSALRGMGSSDVSFGDDHAMNKKLRRDFDGQKRFAGAGPDIGFDQYHL